MTMWDLLSWAGVLAVLGFIVFCFRQGMRVKPDDRSDRSSIQPSDFDPPGRA
jgi:hypothetical protein